MWTMEESVHVRLLTTGGRDMEARACSSGEEAPRRSLNQRQAHPKEDEEEGDEGAEGHTEGADADGRHGDEGKRVLCRGREGKGRGERGVECSCSTTVSRMAPVA